MKLKHWLSGALLALFASTSFAGIGSVSYRVDVAHSFPLGSNLPLFNTSLFEGAELVDVSLRLVSTIEGKGRVSVEDPFFTPYYFAQIAMDIDWRIKEPGQVQYGGFTQHDVVSKTYDLQGFPAGRPVLLDIDLMQSFEVVNHWGPGSAGLQDFITDGSQLSLTDRFLASCTGSRPAAPRGVVLDAPSCYAEVTYTYVPEPAGLPLVLLALGAGALVMRRGSAARIDKALLSN